MKRILFLRLGPYFLPDELSVRENYRNLSKAFCGEIFTVIDKKQLRGSIIGNFSLQGLYLPEPIRKRHLFRNICYAFYSITVSVYRHYFKQKYDVIVASEPIATGPLAFIIGKLTWAKSIVEINGIYDKAFLFNSDKTSFIEYLKYQYSRIVIPFILTHVDIVKTLYKGQIESARWAENVKRIISFPCFVPVSCFEPRVGKTKHILFLGYPWYLKGVDILIKAFNQITTEFPEYSLKIVGYCPDRTEFEKLASGNSRIEFCQPVLYEEVPQLVGECSLFILPSRTEAMGRVLLEAMACKKPIIASNVDGIPMIIQHGKNGLLFESENVEDLALKMRTILGNKGYSRRLAETGYRFVREQWTEGHYLERFRSMIEGAFGNRSIDCVRECQRGGRS